MTDDFDPSDWETLSEEEDASAERQKQDAHDAASKAGRADKFAFVAADDLTLTAPDFLIDDWIERDAFGVIFGPPGCGKTFFALDLSLCVAAALDFHGHGVKPGPVIYIAGEGHGGIARRLHAWARHRGASLSGVPFFKSVRAAQFLNGDHAAKVTEAVCELAAVHGAPALIVIDTLARNYGPGDENATSDMSAFVAAMDNLRAEWPATTVAVVHHTGHENTNRARGSIVLKAACDFEYAVAKKGRGMLEISCSKMKDAPERPAVTFGLESIGLGEAGKSAVLVPAVMDEATEGTKPKKLTANQKLGLDTYKAAAAESGIWRKDGFDGLHVDEWREAFHAQKTGEKKKAFQRVREQLPNLGLLIEEGSIFRPADPAIQLEIAMMRKPREEAA
ncbi:AAA family ATPase [Citromicrobium sp. WPS32]|uniref:AAA family ATPase n=1 Tax=Citromicrobium sp. WPS32 TaxID=1634517 RepID=UPI0006C902EF|nr:AAA family ATPase [Citromicrobium sp. WPS32]